MRISNDGIICEKMNRKEIESRLIMLNLAGSHAYGLATEQSDCDYRGIFIAPRNLQLGLFNIEQKDNGFNEANDPGIYDYLNGTDTCLYEIKKFVNLALKNNPNILECFYLNPEHIKISTPFSKKLYKNREYILSKKIKHSLSGYAFSQLKRLENHRTWLLNPPEKKPTLEEFGLSEITQPLTKSEINTFLEFLYILIRDRIEYIDVLEDIKEIYKSNVDLKGVLVQNTFPVEVLTYVQNLTRSTSDFISLLHKTQLYRKSVSEWNDYIKWQNTRNPKRFAIEKKAGYDGKHASHAIRLLKMGLEALEDQCLYVDRTYIDRPELMSIKNGEMPYAVIMYLADYYKQKLDIIYEKSNLRYSPDFKLLDNLLIELIEEYTKDA